MGICYNAYFNYYCVGVIMKTLSFVPNSWKKKYTTVTTFNGDVSAMKKFCDTSFKKNVYYRQRQDRPYTDAVFTGMKVYDIFYFKSKADATWFRLVFGQFEVVEPYYAGYEQ